MTNTTHEQFGYELTFEGRLGWFSYILDDFEGYIESYWTKTQSEKWDDVDVLPESFRVDYIENQFEKDFDSELVRRCDSDDYSFYDENLHLNCLTVKNTPENKEALEDVYITHEVDEDDESLLNVSSIAQWSWRFYTDTFYSDLIKSDLSVESGIPIEDFQKEGISFNG